MPNDNSVIYIIYLGLYKHVTISSKHLMDAAGNEVWELLTPPSINRLTRIGTAGIYKVKTLVAAAIFRGNMVPLMIFIFYIDLTFGDLYGHFKMENASFLYLLPWGATEQV